MGAPVADWKALKKAETMAVVKVLQTVVQQGCTTVVGSAAARVAVTAEQMEDWWAQSLAATRAIE